MTKKSLLKNDGYINRELSWAEFNARVLAEGLNPRNPLLERLKFISIVSSNFDEFFMVRVANLKRQVASGDSLSCSSGQRPSEVMQRLLARIHSIVNSQYDCLMNTLLPALRKANVFICKPDECNEQQRYFLAHKYEREIFPTLTPVAIKADKPLPSTGNLRLHLAFRLRPSEDAILTNIHRYAKDYDPEMPAPEIDTHAEDAARAFIESQDGSVFVILQLPPSVDRLWKVPVGYDGAIRFVLLEDIILHHANSLFPGYMVEESVAFRITRDADMDVDEDDDVDFLSAMTDVLALREHSKPVRLQMSTATDVMRRLLISALRAEEAEHFEVPGPLELKSFMGLAGRVNMETLCEPEWPPLQPRDLPPDNDLWDVLKERDILLHHPYESFDPVVKMVSDAAVDEGVLAIKMTLYRTSGRSPIIRALALAAENGKQVTAMVELKARFDEERNIQWSRTLERAGVIVIYGIARLKVHSKATMIVRREEDGVHRYVHLSTGNYNDTTAKLYTDMGLMTSRDEITYEVARFFNAVSGLSSTPGLQRLVMAPTGIRQKLRYLIEREIQTHSADSPGLIIAKMNALVDPAIIDLLYQASCAGVKVRLNVRGICCLRPGIKGLSANIEVVSIVDRFLEHTRIYYFRNSGNPDIYLGSADWMPRNLDNRVELLFPIEQADLKTRVIEALECFFQDNVSAHRMHADGTYHRIKPKEGQPLFRSQEHFYLESKRIAREMEAPSTADFQVRRKPSGSRLS